MYDAPPSQAQEGINTLPHFFDDGDLLHVSDSDEEDQYQRDPIIETESHEILEPNPISIPAQNPKPRWAQNLIDAAGYGARNPEDKRRIRSQYQNEHAALSLTDLLPR